MTAPDNENHPVGRVDRQGDFLHLEVDAPGPVQQDQMESGRHFGRLGYPGEIAFRPRAAETQMRLPPYSISAENPQWFAMSRCKGVPLQGPLAKSSRFLAPEKWLGSQ